MDGYPGRLVRPWHPKGLKRAGMSAPDLSPAAAWRDRRVAIVGRLASLTKRDLIGLLKRQGALVVDDVESGADVLLIGEYDLPSPDLAERVDRASEAAGRPIQVVSETEFRHSLDDAASPQRLYTPAMLADLLGVPIAVIRRWHRRGLIHPIREVRRLPYFDFQEIATARNLANMLAAGASPQAIEKQLGSLRRWLPGVDRPLAQLSVIVAGRDLLLRQGEGLLDPGGQYRFDFDAAATSAAPTLELSPSTFGDDGLAADPNSAADLAAAAVHCEEQGRLSEAADFYRAALAAAGPNADYCFQLADILYRLGDVGAARERYWAAIEIDEDFVEARANVGCILAEQGRLDLAIAAFEGALRYHGDFPDVHYHLARVLDEADRRAEAETHWQAFLELVPESPWAESARKRLGIVAHPADDAAAV